MNTFNSSNLDQYNRSNIKQSIRLTRDLTSKLQKLQELSETAISERSIKNHLELAGLLKEEVNLSIYNNDKNKVINRINDLINNGYTIKTILNLNAYMQVRLYKESMKDDDDKLIKQSLSKANAERKQHLCDLADECKALKFQLEQTLIDEEESKKTLHEKLFSELIK